MHFSESLSQWYEAFDSVITHTHTAGSGATCTLQQVDRSFRLPSQIDYLAHAISELFIR
jgi:hypothetical protein